MITRLAVMGLVLLTALLLSTVLLRAASFGMWRPDLVVLTVVAFALADGPGTGARYGFVAGLSVDLLSAGTHVVGSGALVLLLVGYASGAIRPYLAASGLVGQVVVAAAATVVTVASYGLLAHLLEVNATGPLQIALSALATAVYNAVLAPLVLLPVAALARRVPPTQTTSTR